MTDQQTPNDVRGIAAATPPALKRSAPLVAFDDAITDLIEFVAEDALRSSSALPGGRGCLGPDTKKMDELHAAVIEAARAAFFTPLVPVIAAAKADNGLFTLHNPDARLCAAVPSDNAPPDNS